MKKYYVMLRIGEKIGISFGLVGLLFLGVIWQYHQTLQGSLGDQQRLQEVYAAKMGHALAIENDMLQARGAEKDFLLSRDKKYVAKVDSHVGRVLDRAGQLAEIDGRGKQAGERITQLISVYHHRFQAIVQAWYSRGLDHDSGLQGTFRNTVHKLEDRARQFKVVGLYQQLLQIRRGEKDLGLRGEEAYREKVLGLTRGFRERTEASGLDPELKEQLLHEIDTYRETFAEYARSVLAQEDIRGGRGPFRQAAHRIEDLLNAHYIQGLERDILQLRRREKDYLLRGDRQYVDLALEELNRMHVQVDSSSIAEQKKAQLNRLLDDYQRNFLALVEHNLHIERLDKEMRKAILQIAPIVADNAREAEREMQQATQAIQATFQNRARLMLWIVAVAVLLGVLSAVVITTSIARPLRRMSGLLDQLAYEEPVERIPAIPGGRDEVNAMAESVNTMADNKAKFIAWWKKSVQKSAGGKEDAFLDMRGDIRTHVSDIVANAALLQVKHPHRETLAIERSGKTVLEILALLQDRKKCA